MYEQPALQPHRQPAISKPEGTISIDGEALISGRDEADKKLSNPVKVDERTLAKGKKLFNIFCSVCHGPEAKGNGPIASKYVQPPDLAMDFYKQRSDGHIYGTIRFGSVVMPPYGEAMSSEEIWEVVNYLRSLQGK
ncbi:MAG: c-type cytochrome [Candidatus Tectomicrobia bacterium]|uniref:C-type cytochrome n=1 Tax=Tectimicrobiota bacterium TaxID=2528274 RepID=A0A933GP11_UNCTE|nr:c-type cytochrome [Candidatus Tectomicrobia bacterium]